MLKGVVGLVTGAASGLGRATAARLVEEGGRAVMFDLPTSSGAEVAREISASDTIYVPGDVKSEEDVKRALTLCKEKYGQLNVAVNCAGVSVSFLTYTPTSKKSLQLDDFWKMVEVNVVGSFNVIRLAAQLMAENKPDADGLRGTIVNASGTAAYDGAVGQAVQAASCGGVVGMTLPIARDLSNIGVRVCTVAPGLFDTPLTGYLPEDMKDLFGRITPLPQRLGMPDEFARLVQTIITNPMLNGEIIRLDGALRINKLV